MTLRFGTDGVRGAQEELTDELVYALGRAAARVLGRERFRIGRDTRESGPRLERALAAGLVAEGASVDLLGVAPTPAVAWLAAADDTPAAMISASHNAFGDNGIKLFARGGRKLTDDVEARLEAELDTLVADAVAPDLDLGDTGDTDAVRPSTGELARYEDAVIATLDGRRLDGLRVVVDCANGAASAMAPEVLARLGVQVEVLHADPDGRNINDRCGSTHPADLQSAVVRHGADAGLAFDGDADRVLAVDEHGSLVAGDQILAMCAIDMRDRGRLTDDTVVVTVMSNLGFKQGMAATSIKVIETKVGDRYVLEELDQRGLSLGGEQSGHVIFHDLATTGDGLLTGVQVLDLLGRSGRFLSDWAATSMTRLPQVLRNVQVRSRDIDIAERLSDEIAAEESMMGGRGRVLIRPSGTEPLVRVMVEAPSQAIASEVAGRLVQAVERVAGAG
jgi:phosphoglucosamine mutase